MNEIEEIRVFLRVAELSSFTKAAQAMALPRATVSAAVAELEARLGARLLHRTTRRVQLTQDGQMFAERALDVLADVDELNELFSNSGGVLRGRIRVDMPVGLARRVVVPQLRAFIDRYPLVDVELSSTDRLVDVVREGFDVVVRVGSLSDSSLTVRSLGSFRVMNLASPCYLQCHGTPQSPQDLAGHQMVHYANTLGSPADGFDYVDPVTGQERSVAVGGLLTVNNSQAYLAACLAGLGIIQVPEIGMAEELERGELVAILTDYRPAPLPISLVYPNRRHQPRRVRVFMDWLQDVISPHVTYAPGQGLATPS